MRISGTLARVLIGAVWTISITLANSVQPPSAAVGAAANRTATRRSTVSITGLADQTGAPSVGWFWTLIAGGDYYYLRLTPRDVASMVPVGMFTARGYLAGKRTINGIRYRVIDVKGISPKELRVTGTADRTGAPSVGWFWTLISGTDYYYLRLTPQDAAWMAPVGRFTVLGQPAGSRTINGRRYAVIDVAEITPKQLRVTGLADQTGAPSTGWFWTLIVGGDYYYLRLNRLQSSAITPGTHYFVLGDFAGQISVNERTYTVIEVTELTPLQTSGGLPPSSTSCYGNLFAVDWLARGRSGSTLRGRRTIPSVGAHLRPRTLPFRTSIVGPPSHKSTPS